MKNVAVIRPTQSQAVPVPKHFKSPKEVCELFTHLSRLTTDAGILDIGMQAKIMAVCGAQKNSIQALKDGKMPSTYMTKTLLDGINQIEKAAGKASEDLAGQPGKTGRFASNGVDRKR